LTQPIHVSRLETQDYKFQVALPSGIWRWVTRLDVSLGMPSLEVRNVTSPFGTLRDMVPIPGPVITAMAESITTILQAFAPSILVSPTGPLSFTLTQGQGVSMPQPVSITNNGVFGSLLAASITTSAPWLQVVPANLTGLAFNETGSFNVTADSTALLATSSPYSGTITVQDPAATNNPQTIPVSVVVLPPATITVSPNNLVFNVTSSYPSPFPPIPSQQFILSNTGPSGSQLTYLIQKLIGNSPWLVSFTPFMGNLASTQTQAITVAVAPPPNMYSGVYTETLRVSGFSTNMIQDVQIQLIVS